MRISVFRFPEKRNDQVGLNANTSESDVKKVINFGFFKLKIHQTSAMQTALLAQLPPGVKSYEFNPMLTRITTTDGKRQFMLGENPFGVAYFPKPQGNENMKKDTLGKGYSGTVSSRANQYSPFVTKRLTLSATQERMQFANKLAICVMADPVLNKHCVVGVYTNEKKTMSFKVDGFTLSDYLSNPKQFPELNEVYAVKNFKDLQNAVSKLHEKGYAHCDLSKVNIYV
ncbi:MAG: hypothetical protein ACXWIN_06685 [Burkholderiaceae bacterium]